MTETTADSRSQPSDATRPGRGRVVVAGGTGFLGGHLTPALLSAGYDVVVLSRGRHTDADGVRYLQWDPEHWLAAPPTDPEPWEQALGGAVAVVNLCGASAAARRWSDAHKRAMVESRVVPSRALVSAANRLEQPPDTILQASGVNYYGVGEPQRREGDPAGDDFLARLSIAWEGALQETLIRTVILRFGAVLDASQGALPQMLLPFRLFVGGPVAGGRQWLSWIHVQDAVAAIVFAIDSPLTDAVNVTAPNPVRNAEFAAIAGRVLRRPAFVPMPRFVITAALGEGDTLVCDGVRALPARLEATGFRFGYPEMEPALRDLVG